MIELLVENKADGKIYEISEIVTDISFSDRLNNGCSKLDFSYLYDGVLFANGSAVRFKYNNANIFYGYIFSSEREQNNAVSVVAYDQLRYLKAKDTFVVKDLRVDELIRKIANYFRLRVGKLDNTGYKLPTSIKDNQTFLDMIYDSISTTLIGTGRKYAFYDDFGSLSLTDIMNLRLPLIIGDESLAYGYKYGQSIDENTYNLIKISKDNETTGKRDVYIAQDSSAFNKWGVLQYFETADKNANPEQIKAKVNALLKLMNSETKTLSIEALGDTRVRAGSGILVSISDLGINQYVIVNSCKHIFKNNIHTMSLELML
jgi:hypothetical protein